MLGSGHPEFGLLLLSYWLQEKVGSGNENRRYTMVENGKKHRQNSYQIIHFSTSEELSAVEGASEASSPEQANE